MNTNLQKINFNKRRKKEVALKNTFDRLPKELQELIEKKLNENERKNYFRAKLKELQIFNFKSSSHNMFCHLTQANGDTIMHGASTGYFNLTVRRRNLKKAMPEFIKTYVRETKNVFKDNRELNQKAIKLNLKKPKKEQVNVNIKPTSFNKKILAFRIKTTRFLRKKVMKLFKRNLFYWKKNKIPRLLVEYSSDKSFNGCRGYKIRRAKRKYKSSSDYGQFGSIYTDV